jgi:hypothetical protein
MPDATSSEPKREGPVARTIEQQTAKVPSDIFLWAALGSMGLSALLQGSGRKHTSLFVGQWVPVFLMFGLYNKIVKVQGSDQFDPQSPTSPQNPQNQQKRQTPQQQFQARPPQPVPAR